MSFCSFDIALIKSSDPAIFWRMNIYETTCSEYHTLFISFRMQVNHVIQGKLLQTLQIVALLVFQPVQFLF